MLLFVHNQHFTLMTAFITFVKTVSFHENILGGYLNPASTRCLMYFK